MRANRRRLSAVDQRIASKLHILQIDRLARAEGCAEAMVRAIRVEVTRAMTVVLQSRTTRMEERKRRVAEILAGAVQRGIEACTAGQKELARWSHKQVAKIMVQSVPRNWWRRAEPALTLLEREEGDKLKRTIRLGGKRSALQADIRTEPVNQQQLSDEEWEDLIDDVIFPSPSKEKIDRVVFGGDSLTGRHWLETFPGGTSKLSDPVIGDLLIDGYAQGKNVEELTQLILPAEQDVYYKARRTARTESLRIAEQMQRESYKDLGDMLLGVQVLAVLDQNTRPEHAERNGTIYYAEGEGEPTIDELPDLPDEPNSVLPGTWIQGSIITASKAVYSGQVSEIVTASGRRCSITANHPVLTDEGFVNGDTIQEGDYLIAYRDDIFGQIQGTNNVEQKPSRIEDVFCSLRQSRGSFIAPTSGRDFHGDAEFFYGDVEIVSPEWKLGSGGDFSTAEFRNQLLLHRTVQLSGFGPSRCKTRKSVLAIGSAEMSVTAKPSRLRNVPGIVFVSNLCRIGSAAKLDVAFHESRTQKASRDAERASHLQQRFSGQVFFDRVVNVNRCHYAGPVFDVQTDTGVMVANCRNDANGLLISNCRCWSAPVLKPPEDFKDDPLVMASFLNDSGLAIPDPAVYGQWFAAAPIGAQKDAVGVGRYNAMASMLGTTRKPEWSDFLDPTTAKLLPPATLRGETDAARADRKQAVDAAMRERENLIKQVAARGFLLPPKDQSGMARAGS